MEISSAAKQEKASSENKDLSKQVFSIIDSKIQYIKFMIKEVVKDYIDMDKVKELPADSAIPFFMDMDHIIQKNAAIFEKIEAYNKSLHRMLLLRNELTSWNSETIFYLISDENHLNYSNDNIMQLLQKPHHISDQRVQQVAI